MITKASTSYFNCTLKTYSVYTIYDTCILKATRCFMNKQIENVILSPFAAEVRFDCMIECLSECFYMSAPHTHPPSTPTEPQTICNSSFYVTWNVSCIPREIKHYTRQPEIDKEREREENPLILPTSTTSKRNIHTYTYIYYIILYYIH